VDWHCHSRWSDGQSTLAELAASAARRGVAVGVSDHGLRDNRRLRTREQLRAYQADLARHPLLRGVEISVGDVAGENGAGYPDNLLDELDYVIASPHVVHLPEGAVHVTRYLGYRAGLYPAYSPSLPNLDRLSYFAAWRRTLEATLRRWPVRILGHFCVPPELARRDGRYALDRDPEPDDEAAAWLDETIRLCVRHDVAIELNSKSRVPHAAFVARALELGARFSGGSDAHPRHRAGDLSYGRELIRRLKIPPTRLLGAAGVCAAPPAEQTA
jgi:histidinol phosphatase-like PHP family hydrolase